MNRASHTDSHSSQFRHKDSAAEGRAVERLATMLALDADRAIDQAGMLNHLAATAELVERYDGTSEQVRAGWLHEALSVESPSRALLDEIQARFGGGVIDIIERFSAAPCYPALPRRTDHPEHFQRLETLDADSPALLVLGADALHQARQVHGALRASGGGRDTRAGRVAANAGDLFDTLISLLEDGDLDELAADLQRVCDQVQCLLDDSARR